MTEYNDDTGFKAILLLGIVTQIFLNACTGKILNNQDSLLSSAYPNNIINSTIQTPLYNDSIPEKCGIELSVSNKLSKEYACNIYLFQYHEKTAYIDSNYSRSGYYYSLIDSSFATLRVFEYYDSPTGRRRLLLFETREQNILRSDWFDNTASADSIDISSINVTEGSFVAWEKNDDKAGRSYEVKFYKSGSW